MRIMVRINLYNDRIEICGKYFIKIYFFIEIMRSTIIHLKTSNSRNYEYSEHYLLKMVHSIYL